jgi:hypothetical protein
LGYGRFCIQCTPTPRHWPSSQWSFLLDSPVRRKGSIKESCYLSFLVFWRYLLAHYLCTYDPQPTSYMVDNLIHIFIYIRTYAYVGFRIVMATHAQSLSLDFTITII